MRTRLIIFISIVQSIILLGHWFLYLTLSSFWGGVASSSAMKLILCLLAVSFVGASLRGWYSFRPLVRVWYTLAAVWLGFASYFLWASVICWLVYAVSMTFHLGWTPQLIADVLFGLAAAVGAYALINANVLRVTRISVALPGLPEQWRGRTALMMSDLHLGHIRNRRFLRRVLSKVKNLEPDVVFIAGDLYDGTAGDFERLAEPWAEFLSPAQATVPEGELIAQTVSGGRPSQAPAGRVRRQSGLAASRNPGPPRREAGGVRDRDSEEEGPGPHNSFFGVYYITGNHEEFYSHEEYLAPLTRAGVRLLNNEKVELDGLQLVGVHYRDAIQPDAYRAILRRAGMDRNRASILLLHAPVKLAIAEEEGISLQLSGHTHGGQFFPYTWIAGRVWGRFIYGLQRLGNLQVYTSYGAGTWGPPLRLGTRPELVLIRFS